MTAKKIIGKIHLWLGLGSGLLVVFLGITGCILAFQREIELVTNRYQFVEARSQAFLPPSDLKKIAVKELPGKSLHSLTYGKKDQAAVLAFYHEDPAYYYLVYLNPYSGDVLKVKNMDDDFFRIIINGHFYLWLPPAIGQPIVASATLIFLLMMISGIILWWPRNKAARKQRFKIAWNVKWRRKNYDLHNVLGFYMSWVAIFIAITGLVMGFQWFAKSVYWVTSGGDSVKAYYEPTADPSQKRIADTDPVDAVWKKMQILYPATGTIEVHFPETDSAVIGANANPNPGTYWKTDYRYFDPYTLEEKKVDHAYGRYHESSAADKIARMNYDVHVGAIGGLPTKILAFFASLIAASLPVTGFLIWWGRKKKSRDAVVTGIGTKTRVDTKRMEIS